MGRNLKYKSGKALQAKIDEYFKYCEGKPLLDYEGNAVTDKYGYPVRADTHVPTVTGLARFLGLASRQALLNYQGRESFRPIVEEAKMRIEEYAEERLFDRDGVQGAKFTLSNNFGWSDKAEDKDDIKEAQAELLGAIKRAVGNENN